MTAGATTSLYQAKRKLAPIRDKCRFCLQPWSTSSAPTSRRSNAGDGRAPGSRAQGFS